MSSAAELRIKSRLSSCEHELNPVKSIQIDVRNTHEPPERAVGDGCGILLFAKTTTGCTIGASGLGERGVPAELVGQRAADELMDVLESCACVDDWLMDQLVVFMAAAKGLSVVVGRELTLHTHTAIEVAQQLTKASFTCTRIRESPELWEVKCIGAGLTRLGSSAHA